MLECFVVIGLVCGFTVVTLTQLSASREILDELRTIRRMQDLHGEDLMQVKLMLDRRQ